MKKTLAVLTLGLISLCFASRMQGASVIEITSPTSHPTFGAIDPELAVPVTGPQSKLAVNTTDTVPTPTNVAPHVSWYAFPSSGPNDQVLSSFPLWRDTLGNGLALFAGNPIATSSRVYNPAGVEIKDEFEEGDATIPNPSSTNHLWRAQLDPWWPQSYVDQKGSHTYCPILVVGNGVKIALAGLSYRVHDDKSILDNKSSLVTNSYSVSRIGIIAGPSGDIFGNDAIIVKTGAGTNLVDAIFFIGARFGVWVNGQQGIDDFNAYIPCWGDQIRFDYSYTWTTNDTTMVQTFEKVVTLYKQDQIPLCTAKMEYFPTPIGMLFSLVAAEWTDYTTWTSRKATGPWMQKSATTTTGWSWEWTYTRNPTNDCGYVKFQDNLQISNND